MVKFLIPLIFIISFMPKAFSKCELKLYPRYLVMSDTSSLMGKHFVKGTDCEDAIVSKVIDLLKNSKGTLSSNQITRMIKLEKQVRISPSKIQIEDLSSALSAKIGLKKGWGFKNAKFMYGKKIIHFEKNEVLSISCHNCQYTGVKNFKLEQINPITNKKVVSWGETTVVVRSFALVSKHSIAANTILTMNDFEKRVIYDKSPAKFFSNSAKIIFYRTNKGLPEGAPLKFSDIAPVNLVQMGKPVQVIMNSSSLSLRSTATPIRSGKFGETIQLKNLRNNQLIVGKIVDFNKVQVEL